MPSPFPGMDPYIEHPLTWSDFHANLAPEIQGQLNAVIQPRYVARLIPHVTYEVVEITQKRAIRPDVGVWQSQYPQQRAIAAAPMITPAPAQSAVAIELPLELFSVEIYLVETLELVTAIEILSPVNKKRGHEAYVEYQRKRRELLRSEAHLLEIDLLRGGARMPLEEPVPAAPYYIVLSRAQRRPRVEVWPIQLSERLPVLPVPLREPDPDVALDLRAALEAIYQRGGYATLLDYRRPPPPPALTHEEAKWVEEHLQKIRAR